jgi:hypothetical protein
MSTTPQATMTAGVLAGTDVIAPDALEGLLRLWCAALEALAGVTWPSTTVDELARRIDHARAAV